MKKILFFLIITFLLLPFSVSAKQLEKEWSLSYGGSGIDFLNSGIVTSDGNILVVGSTQSSDIEGLNNNGGRDAIILMYDSKGNLLWQDIWGGDALDAFSDVIEGSGGYYVIGTYNSTNIEGISNSGGSDAIVIKYDKNGNIIWTRTFGGNKDENPKSIFEAEDGFIVSGHYWSTDIVGLTNKGRCDGLLIKYDWDGNLIWKKSWGGNEADIFSDILVDKNNDVVVVGYFDSTDIEGFPNSGDDDGIILKFDSSGNIIWTKTLNRSSSDRFMHVSLTNDNNYFVYVNSIFSDISESISPNAFIKYDQNGNIVFSNNYSSETNDFFYSLYTMKDGSILAVGTSSSITKTETGNKLMVEGLILQFDKNGNYLFRETYGGSSSDYFYSVMVDKDDNIYILGYTYSSDFPDVSFNGQIDGIILKCIFKHNINLNSNISNGAVNVNQYKNQVSIIPMPDNGYEVDNIIVKDTSGNVLDVEVIKHDDGTYVFELFGDVSVEVLFKEILTNPKTGVFNPIIFIPAIMVLGMCVYFIKSCEKSYEL